MAAGKYHDVPHAVLAILACFTRRQDLAEPTPEEIPEDLDLTTAGELLALRTHAIHILPIVWLHWETIVTGSTDPTVLWRMTRGRAIAHATIIPGDSATTLTWFFDGVMDRAENYDNLELAMARADHIRGVLMRDGWTDAP